MKEKIKETKGITLIALVVTILVLIILTSIAVGTIGGKNGLLTKAKEVEQNEVLAQEEGQARINELNSQNVLYGGGATSSTDTTAPIINSISVQDRTSSTLTVKVNVTEQESGISIIEYSCDNGTTWAKDAINNMATTYKFTGLNEDIYTIKARVTDKNNNSTIATINVIMGTVAKYKKLGTTVSTTNNKTLIDDNYNNVVVPAGFKIASDSATDENYGVVIEDTNGNQFVWIPVADSSAMYKAETKTLTTATSVSTNYYSLFRIRSGDSYTATTPGSTSGIREPDLLTSYDTDSQYYSTILGYADTTAMATGFVKDYKDMIDSVNTNKGFYVGRYELTGSVASPTEKAGTTLAGTNWYNLYKACKNVETGNSHAITSMMWGCQYDEIMSWLKATVFKTDTSKVDTDSSSWGNYGTSSVIATGSNTTYKANNIYDIAGNCYEWTQEANDTGTRVGRGGSCNFSGSGRPASHRSNNVPYFSYSYSSSRPVLYIK